MSKCFDLSTSTHTLGEETMLLQYKIRKQKEISTLPATQRFPLTGSQINYLPSPSIFLIYYHNSNRHENRG